MKGFKLMPSAGFRPNDSLCFPFYAKCADWGVPIYSTLEDYTHREGAGMYPVYRCADGWLRLIIIAAHHWRALRAWMGEPQELQDPALDGFIQRLAHRGTIEPIIQKFFQSWKKQDAAREAQWRGIPATPVLQSSEVLDNEHTRERGTFVELELLPGQRASVASGFFEFDGVRMGPAKPAPQIGEHKQEVYADEIRLEADSIQALARDEVI